MKLTVDNILANEDISKFELDIGPIVHAARSKSRGNIIYTLVFGERNYQKSFFGNKKYLKNDICAKILKSQTYKDMMKQINAASKVCRSSFGGSYETEAELLEAVAKDGWTKEDLVFIEGEIA